MAELSTIARPYAHALLLALRDAKKGPEEAADLAAVLDGIAQVVTTPELVSVIGDPKLSSEQIYDLIVAGLGQVKLPEEAANLLKVVVENGRLEAVPEIARQFRELKNQSEGASFYRNGTGSRQFHHSVTDFRFSLREGVAERK